MSKRSSVTNDAEDKGLPPAERRDYQLLKRYAAGDERAFIDIYDAYSKKLLQYVYHCTGDWQEAEDIVQEVFVQVMKDAATFEPRASLSTWIYRVATFMCLKRHRDRTIRRRIIDREAAAGTFDRTGGGAEGERSAVLSEQVAAIGQIVQSLPLDQKTAFVLREYENKTYEQIANVTDSEIGTVKSRIFRARQSIRDEMRRRGLL